VSAVLPHDTIALPKKFVPFTVSVNPDPPAAAEVGLRLVIVATPGVIVKPIAGDVEPSLFTTVTGIEPVPEIMSVVIEPLSFVALTRVVVTGIWFHRIFAPVLNELPFTVSVNALPPAFADAGLRVVMVAGLPMLNGTNLDAP
jgi:hypothetical protein